MVSNTTARPRCFSRCGEAADGYAGTRVAKFDRSSLINALEMSRAAIGQAA